MNTESVEIVRLNEGDLSRCADFLAKALDVKRSCLVVSEDYLRWKYLDASGGNLCLLLKIRGQICAVVGGIVWRYVIEGKETDICFPVDWFSSADNPVRGMGQQILRALIAHFPASVAIGGLDICFEPQILVGFSDVGDILVLGCDTAPGAVLRHMLHLVSRPMSAWRGAVIRWQAGRQGKTSFQTISVDDDALVRFEGEQLFSRGVPRRVLLDKWRHHCAQSSNSAKVITIRREGILSYALVVGFTDARKGSLALGDALVAPGHRPEDIIGSVGGYARLHGYRDVLIVTNDTRLIDQALTLGFWVRFRHRTQYYARSDGPICRDIHSLPSVSFLSYDGMMYRVMPQDMVTRCGRECATS